MSHINYTTHFYDQIAGDYERLLNQLPGDRWVRSAFQQLVNDKVAKGTSILDFGCGTGIDALYYTNVGYDVVAYDNSAGMIDELQRRCAVAIAAGQITPLCFDYQQFLTNFLGVEPASAIVSNFAVLNLVDSVEPLFAKFAQLLRPAGYIIVSVLNPFFWKEIIRTSWWRSVQVNWHQEVVRQGQPSLYTYRHFVRRIDRAASPYFEKEAQASVGSLIRYNRAQLNWSHPTTTLARIERRGWLRLPLNQMGKFIFLVYRKRI